MIKVPNPAIPNQPSSIAGRRMFTGVFLIGWLWSGWALAMLALGVCWLLFFNALQGEWQVNPQYNYGYVVPLLTAVLFWRRWPDRPVAIAGRSPLLSIMVVGLLLLQFPLTLVLEANPEWRLLYWINGFQVLGLTLGLLYWRGGWHWIRHFGLPLVFVLIAIPWPMELEQWVIQGLMKFVATLTVGVVNMLNIPAVQHGNLIEVGTGVVGIDEACSGVRSLQSALMLSLFLGEMYRFSLLRRGVLLGASMLFVLLANLTRTTMLVWTAANRGLHQMEAWHDTIGTVVMLVVLPSLMGLAYLMKVKAPPEVLRPDQGPDLFPKMSRWMGISALGWLLAVQAATELWYSRHEANFVPNTRWSVVWPVQNPQFKKTAIPENSLALLRCSDSEAGIWQDEAGNQWSAFLLQWKPGKNSEQLAKGHRPDICFPAAGARLADDFGRVTLDANGVQLNFRHLSFESGSKLLHVFYCLWSDRISLHEEPRLKDGSQASRIQAVMEGKRNLGQRVFEIVVAGPYSNDAAVDLIKTELPLLVRRD
jgi:exosortase